MKNLLKRVLIMLLCVFSILNMFFYTTYWGYYYRNPWANSGYPAPISNNAIESISSINPERYTTPWIHTIATDRAVIVRDILGLTTGMFVLNPTTREDESLPIYIRRTLSYIPDIVIVESKHDFLKEEFKPLKQINITSSIVSIYLISEPKNITATKAAIIAPLAHPSLAPEYYLSLLKLQKEFPKEKLLILDDVNDLRSSGARLIGRIEYKGLILLNPNVDINISKASLEGYRFIVLKSRAATITPIIPPIFCGGEMINKKLVNIYPAYTDRPSEFLISISKLQSVCKNGIIYFPSAEKVMLVKDYSIKINQTLSKVSISPSLGE
jgi:hypothetical protein